MAQDLKRSAQSCVHGIACNVPDFLGFEYLMDIITGMHRSGTSLVGRILFASGRHFGSISTFHPADQWNPEGYFEQVDIIRFNLGLCCDWLGRVRYLAPLSEARILDRGHKQAARLLELTEKYKNAIVKDPRFCLTLPAWRGPGSFQGQVVICFRHPTSVALSLKRRNKLPMTLGYRMWRLHNQHLMNACQGLRSILVSYERLLHNETYVSEVRALLRFFNVAPSEQELRELCQRTVNPSLNHGNDAREWMPPSIQRLWDHLNERHSAQGTQTGMPL